MDVNFWRPVFRMDLKMKIDLLNDKELDLLLKVASTPVPDSGFENRLMTKLGQAENSNVVAFQSRPKPKRWLVALPLAASLAFGVWLGSSDFSSTLLGNNTSQISDSSAAGVEDVTSFIEENLS
jgi:hypothetical protein